MTDRADSNRVIELIAYAWSNWLFGVHLELHPLARVQMLL